MAETYLHPNAIVESAEVGAGTRVWAFAHVMKGARVGADCNVGEHCFIESGAVIGNGVTVKNGNMVWDGVILEDGVFVGPAAVFTNDQHPRSPRLGHAAKRYATRDWLVPTLVKHGASIGAAAVIVAGVEIGEFAMVAAGAVVTRSVPAHALVMGVPARHSGWVCECGQTLRLVNDEAVCPDCSLDFECRNGLLLHRQGVIAVK